MLKDEWSRAQEALKSLFSFVKLKIDGYEVTLSLVRVDTYKNAIAVYVNGVFKGEWLMKDCEERRRFLQRKERSLLSQKQKSSWSKLPKKLQRELNEKYDRKYEYYSSHWTSFNALKKHFISNNKNIELISID